MATSLRILVLTASSSVIGIATDMNLIGGDRNRMIEMLKLGSGERSAAMSAQRDIITGVVVFAAIIMFIGSGTTVLSASIAMLTGVGGGAERTLTVAVLLNVALILFGWRRYRDLSSEVVERTAAEERAQTLALHDLLPASTTAAQWPKVVPKCSPKQFAVTK